MKILSLLLILFSAGSLTSTQAAVELPELMEYQDTKLTLNGQGTRVMFFVKIYESGLDLNSVNSNAEEVINENSAMGIRLDVISSMLTADTMKKAIDILNSHNMFDKQSMGWAIDRGIHFLETNFDIEEK